jgi:myo-inositol 2-dehydrogenase/D-chiro-inositol 1-dehydrogenase
MAAMRFGLVGYGMFGHCHARCLADTAGVELRAIATTSEANRAAARADHPGARVVADWREIVRASDIDALDIVAPNHLHAEMAVAALDAGKHVLLEKPMATTAEDAALIVEAVRRSGRQLSVGHELRLSAQWSPIKRLIDEGGIGTPRYANMSLFRFPYRAGGQGWRHDPARVGSWILEEPIHFYDLLMWYLEDLGPPVAVHAKGTVVDGGMFDNFTSWLAFSGGAYATVTQSLGGFGHHLLLEIAGSAGAIRSWWSAADARSERPQFRLEVQRAGATAPQPVEVPESGELFELAAQIREVAAAFAEGRTLVSAEAGRRAVVVCLEAERALREGREVPLLLA